MAWKRCSSCKGDIEHGATYWVCSVSTCNRKRTALSFCSVSCWDAHLPVARHREAWAEEREAPSEAAAAREAAAPSSGGGGGAERSKQRRLVRPSEPARPTTGADDEILIVASRLKQYVREHSGYSTSDRVLTPLSLHVRRIVGQAIENARREGRRTVLDRDIPEA